MWRYRYEIRRVKVCVCVGGSLELIHAGWAEGRYKRERVTYIISNKNYFSLNSMDYRKKWKIGKHFGIFFFYQKKVYHELWKYIHLQYTCIYLVVSNNSGRGRTGFSCTPSLRAFLNFSTKSSTPWGWQECCSGVGSLSAS